MTLLRLIAKGIAAVVHVVVLFLKILYKACAFLRIRLLVLYLIVCGFLALCFHTFTGNMPYFWAGAGICLFFTLLSWGWYLRKRRLKKASRAAFQAEKEEPEDPAAAQPEQSRQPVWPRYFDVAGYPGYIYAEYENRYELLRLEEDGYHLVRTDFR